MRIRRGATVVMTIGACWLIGCGAGTDPSVTRPVSAKDAIQVLEAAGYREAGQPGTNTAQGQKNTAGIPVTLSPSFGRVIAVYETTDLVVSVIEPTRVTKPPRIVGVQWFRSPTVALLGFALPPDRSAGTRQFAALISRLHGS